jgi:hypothetical protein
MIFSAVSSHGPKSSPKPFGKYRTAILSVLLVALACPFTATAEWASDPSGGIRIAGPGVQPQLGFACCDKGIDAMQELFADPDVIAELADLHAEVAVQVADFSPQRAAIVARLNQAGISVVAWLVLAPQDGFYLDADDAGAAAARVAAFEKWTRENHLHWDAVGFDIEPDFNQLAALRNHRLRLLGMLLLRSLNMKRMTQARQAYSSLIHQLQGQGFRVQTYQMPYLPAERDVGTALIDRMLGTVDVRGNDEYLMLYSSYARQVGAAIIWSLGRGAQGISIGVTDGGTPGSGMGALDWNEFSRDLIVASHFTRQIGVYNLEGCVHQGFLRRLETMDWNQSVVISAASIARAKRLGLVIRTVLWIVSRLPWLLTAALLLITWWIVHRRIGKKRAVTA